MEKELLETVEKYIEKTGITPSKLGLDSVRNPNIVFNLRKGKGCNIRTADRVIAFIKANNTLNLRVASHVANPR